MGQISCTRHKQTILMDGQKWDVKYIPTSNPGTIWKYIKDARKANNVLFYAEDVDKAQEIFNAYNVNIKGHVSRHKTIADLPNVYMLCNNRLVLLIKTKGA